MENKGQKQINYIIQQSKFVLIKKANKNKFINRK